MCKGLHLHSMYVWGEMRQPKLHMHDHTQQHEHVVGLMMQRRESQGLSLQDVITHLYCQTQMQRQCQLQESDWLLLLLTLLLECAGLCDGHY